MAMYHLTRRDRLSTILREGLHAMPRPCSRMPAWGVYLSFRPWFEAADRDLLAEYGRVSDFVLLTIDSRWPACCPT
jgi:hypothetical protein